MNGWQVVAFVELIGLVCLWALLLKSLAGRASKDSSIRSLCQTVEDLQGVVEMLSQRRSPFIPREKPERKPQQVH